MLIAREIIWRFVIGALIAIFTALGTDIAGAASLTAIPVRIYFRPGQKVTSMTVINHGRRQVGFQVRPFVWSQDNNRNVLKPTNALLVSPPLGTLNAGARQVIRFALRKIPKNREDSYRILLDELPPPAAPGTVQIALRLSIPIFAEPNAPVSSRVDWHIADRDHHAYLVVVNKGTRHITAQNIKLTTPDGHSVKVKITGTPYVLAGATRRWPIEASRPLTPGTILWMVAQTDTGHIAKKVRVANHL